jgi:CRP/FNR family transcriptional regulator, cyclic AMP receptor protein
MDVIAYFKAARNILTLPRGAVVFHEGDPGKDMYVRLQGTVEISVGGDVVELAYAGALLGKMALVDSAPRSATAITRTDCRFVLVDAREFDLLVRESPEFARHVMKTMADRLRHMNEKLREAIGELSVPGGRRPR